MASKKKEQPRFYLSLDRLEANGACSYGRRAWRAAFGTKQVPVTRALLDGMAEEDYLDWLFQKVFPSDVPAAVQEAWKRLLNADIFTEEEEAALRAYQRAQIDAILNAPLLKDR
jgi:hypothetical protein